MNQNIWLRSRALNQVVKFAAVQIVSTVSADNRRLLDSAAPGTSTNEKQNGFDLGKFLDEQIAQKPMNQIYLACGCLLLIILCWIAVQVQYCHQRAYLAERLPAAHLKLFRGMMAQEAVSKLEVIRREQIKANKEDLQRQKLERQRQRARRAGQPIADMQTREPADVKSKEFNSAATVPPEEYPLEQFDKLLLSHASLSSDGALAQAKQEMEEKLQQQQNVVKASADVQGEVQERKSNQQLKEEPDLGMADKVGGGDLGQLNNASSAYNTKPTPEFVAEERDSSGQVTNSVITSQDRESRLEKFRQVVKEKVIDNMDDNVSEDAESKGTILSLTMNAGESQSNNFLSKLRNLQKSIQERAELSTTVRKTNPKKLLKSSMSFDQKNDIRSPEERRQNMMRAANLNIKHEQESPVFGSKRDVEKAATNYGTFGLAAADRAKAEVSADGLSERKGQSIDALRSQTAEETKQRVASNKLVHMRSERFANARNDVLPEGNIKSTVDYSDKSHSASKSQAREDSLHEKLKTNALMQLMKRGLQASNGSNSGSLSASRPDLLSLESPGKKEKTELSKYQEKMMRKRKSKANKKLQDKLFQFAKISGKRSLASKKDKKSGRESANTPRSKSQETLSARQRSADEEELDEEELAKIERRRRLANLHNIGNASKIGSRPGEKPIRTEVIDNEFGEGTHQVSIFRREANHRQDVHMAIISKHRAELVREELLGHLRNRIDKTFTKKRNPCLVAIEKFFTCHWEYFSAQEAPFLNKHAIEDYIDQYFLLHVPATLSLGENYEQVYTLIHELFVRENELALHESQAECRAHLYEGERRARTEIQRLSDKEERDLQRLLRPKKARRTARQTDGYMSYDAAGDVSRMPLKHNDSVEIHVEDIEKGQHEIGTMSVVQEDIHTFLGGAQQHRDHNERQSVDSEVRMVNMAAEDSGDQREGGQQDDVQCQYASIVEAQPCPNNGGMSKRATTSEVSRRVHGIGQTPDAERREGALTVIDHRATHKLPASLADSPSQPFKRRGMAYAKTRQRDNYRSGGDRSVSGPADSRHEAVHASQGALTAARHSRQTAILAENDGGGDVWVAEARTRRLKRMRDPVLVQKARADSYEVPKPMRKLRPQYNVCEHRAVETPISKLRNSSVSSRESQPQLMVENDSCPSESQRGYVSLMNLPTRMQFKRRNAETVTAVIGEAILLESLQTAHKPGTVGTGQLQAADQSNEGVPMNTVLKNFREGTRSPQIRAESTEEALTVQRRTHRSRNTMQSTAGQLGTGSSAGVEDVNSLGLRYGLNPNYMIGADRNIQLQVSENLLAHTEMINSILIAIKPNISQMCCTPFTAQMVKQYFREVREEQLELMNVHRIEAMERSGSQESCESNEVLAQDPMIMEDQAAFVQGNYPATVSLDEIRKSRQLKNEHQKSQIAEEIICIENPSADMIRANASNMSTLQIDQLNEQGDAREDDQIYSSGMAELAMVPGQQRSPPLHSGAVAHGGNAGLDQSRFAGGTETINSRQAVVTDLIGQIQSPKQINAKNILICNQLDLNSSSLNDPLPFEQRESQLSVEQDAGMSQVAENAQVTMKLAQPTSSGDTEDSPGGEATPMFQRTVVIDQTQAQVVPDQDEAAPQESDMQQILDQMHLPATDVVREEAHEDSLDYADQEAGEGSQSKSRNDQHIGMLEQQVAGKLQSIGNKQQVLPDSSSSHANYRSRTRLARDPVTFQAEEQDGASTVMSGAAPQSKTTKDQTQAQIMTESNTLKELHAKNIEQAENANDRLADMDMVIAESRPMTVNLLAGESKRGSTGRQNDSSINPYGSYGDSAGTRNQTAAQAHRNKLNKAEFTTAYAKNIASKFGSRRSSVGAAPSPGGFESRRVLDEAMNQIMREVEQEKASKQSCYIIGASIKSRAISPAIAMVLNKDPVSGVPKRNQYNPEFMPVLKQQQQAQNVWKNNLGKFSSAARKGSLPPEFTAGHAVNMSQPMLSTSLRKRGSVTGGKKSQGVGSGAPSSPMNHGNLKSGAMIHSPYAKSRSRAAANRSLRFHEGFDVTSVPRLASRDSASIAAETIQGARYLHANSSAAGSKLSRRQLLKMQGSQIIDSKYGPIHQRMSTGATNVRSNMRGSQNIIRGVALDTMSNAHTLANQLNKSQMDNHRRMHIGATASEPATAPPKRPAKAIMLHHGDLSREAKTSIDLSNNALQSRAQDQKPVVSISGNNQINHMDAAFDDIDSQLSGEIEVNAVMDETNESVFLTRNRPELLRSFEEKTNELIMISEGMPAAETMDARVTSADQHYASNKHIGMSFQPNQRANKKQGGGGLRGSQSGMQGRLRRELRQTSTQQPE